MGVLRIGCIAIPVTDGVIVLLMLNFFLVCHLTLLDRTYERRAVTIVSTVLHIDCKIEYRYY